MELLHLPRLFRRDPVAEEVSADLGQSVCPPSLECVQRGVAAQAVRTGSAFGPIYQASLITAHGGVFLFINILYE